MENEKKCFHLTEPKLNRFGFSKVEAFFLFLLLSCQQSPVQKANVTRAPTYASQKNPIFGTVVPSTSTKTTTKTSTSTSTATATSTSTTAAFVIDNSPPTPLSSNGNLLSADQATDCPNSACLLSVDPSVTSALATHTLTATKISTSTIFGVGNIPIRNYFKSKCLVTPILDVYQPVFWEVCSSIAAEGFNIEKVGVNFIIHPKSRVDLCFNVPGTPATGMQIDLETCDGSMDQEWSFDTTTLSPVTFIHPVSSFALCLVRGSNSQGQLTVGLWTCSIKNTNLMFETLHD